MTRKQRIYNILMDAIKPVSCDVTDNSHQHRVPDGSESHFHIVLVSETFTPQSRIDRSRWIHKLLADELTSGLHALSLNLYTPSEWQKRNQQASPVPPCQHKLVEN